MEEYEYSIRANKIEPFLEYCKNNNYVLKNKTTQNRVVYENLNNRKILARITKTSCEEKEITILDYKNVSGDKDNSLKVSKESLEMEVTDENKEIILSMLDVLDFEKVADNLRVRYEYVKDNVKFEIDDYVRPLMKVVAIEGEKKQVDRVYEEIMKTLSEYIDTNYH